jgi:hypothetical protein
VSIYACNCGATFDSPIERLAHMVEAMHGGAPNLPQFVTEAITELAGANRLYEDHKHDLWRGDSPRKDCNAARGRLEAAIERYAQEQIEAQRKPKPARALNWFW